MPGILVTFASDQHTRVPRLPEGNQLKKFYDCLFQLLLKHAGLDAPGLSCWVYIIPSVFLVLIHDISMSLIPVLVRDLEATGLPTTHTLNGEQSSSTDVPSLERIPSLSFVVDLVHIPLSQSLIA